MNLHLNLHLYIKSGENQYKIGNFLVNVHRGLI